MYFFLESLCRIRQVQGFSILYNMSARHERQCDTNDTSATQVRRECYTNDTSVARVKNVDFDNDSSENIFSHSYINYITNERLQGEE